MFQLDNYGAIVEGRCTDTQTPPPPLHTHTHARTHAHTHFPATPQRIHLQPPPRSLLRAQCTSCPDFHDTNALALPAAAQLRRLAPATATQGRRVPEHRHAQPPRDTRHKIHDAPAPSRAPRANTVPTSGFCFVSHCLKTSSLCMCACPWKSQSQGATAIAHTLKNEDNLHAKVPSIDM